MHLSKFTQLPAQPSKRSDHTFKKKYSYNTDSEVFNSAHHNLWLQTGLGQVLHPVEGDHNPAFHSSANGRVHAAGQYKEPTPYRADVGQWEGLSNRQHKIADLAATEQKKPHNQLWIYTSTLYIQIQSDCQT